MNPGAGQCQLGSLTGAVSSKRVTEEYKGNLSLVGNQATSVKVEGCLTARLMSRAGTKVGLSDPVVPYGRAIAQRIKGTPGITGLIPPKSSYRRRCLAPRCRLITSWGCSRSQGYGCSPMKVVRELGSDRRETGRSLSAVGARNLRRFFFSTRGFGRTQLWCTSCHASGTAG